MADGIFQLIEVIALASGLLALVVLWRRPGWAHLDIDALAWRETFTRVVEWLRDYQRQEAVVAVGAFCVGFLFTGAATMWGRLMAGLTASLASAVIGLLVLVAIEHTRGLWRVVDRAKREPFDLNVEFRADVVGDMALLRVVSKLTTGNFSAQVWLTGGAAHSNDQFSLPWENTNAERREIGKGETQTIRVLRVTRTEADGIATVGCYLQEAGGRERALRVTHAHRHGNDVVHLDPLDVHIRLTDPNGTIRPVVVRVTATTLGERVFLGATLIRPY